MLTHLHTHLRRQNGLATLTTAVVLLVCTTLIVLYAANQGVIEQWISGNESRYNSAFAQAEAGLDEAIARYKEDSSMTANPAACTQDNAPPIDSSTWGGGRFCTTRTSQTISGKTFSTFTSQGTSDDNTASVTVYKHIGFAPLVGNGTPASPIIADGTMGSGGNFNVSVNPNGGGLGVPVSIWTSDAATMGSSSATCQPQYMTSKACPNGGSGASNLLSEAGAEGLDIVDNAAKVSAGGTFPNDVFEYLFGVPVANYLDVKAKAKQITAAQCNTLSTASKGLYWISGGGTCSVGNTGQADDPSTAGFDETNAVILVLDETALTINANSEVYGYVFTLDHPGDIAPDSFANNHIKLNGGAKIFGSFLSNYDMGDHLNGTMGVVWTDYAKLFSNPGSSDYGALAVIPGGWRDFQ